MGDAVRCRFQCQAVGAVIGGTIYEKKDDGTDDFTKAVGRQTLFNVKLAPIHSSDPKSENKACWNSSPSGSLELNTITQDVFEIGKDYFIDITPAS